MVEHLKIPTDQEANAIVESCLDALHSYETEFDENERLFPNICAVCDSLPQCSNDHIWIPVPEFKEYCTASRLQSLELVGQYPAPLLQGYAVHHPSLKEFVLSPYSLINRKENTILVCKGCNMELERNHKKEEWNKNLPPINSIANGYLIGETPPELKELNSVELSLVSKVQTYCQTWMFKGGPHQQIKGWHTFFKNRPSSHVGSLKQLKWAELKGNILVVLCGPFTKTQKALTLQKVQVRPEKVVNAYKWLIANNIYYSEDRIPDISEIPIPEIFQEDV